MRFGLIGGGEKASSSLVGGEGLYGVGTCRCSCTQRWRQERLGRSSAIERLGVAAFFGAVAFLVFFVDITSLKVAAFFGVAFFGLPGGRFGLTGHLGLTEVKFVVGCSEYSISAVRCGLWLVACCGSTTDDGP